MYDSWPPVPCMKPTSQSPCCGSSCVCSPSLVTVHTHARTHNRFARSVICITCSQPQNALRHRACVTMLWSVVMWCLIHIKYCTVAMHIVKNRHHAFWMRRKKNLRDMSVLAIQHLQLKSAYTKKHSQWTTGQENLIF